MTASTLAARKGRAFVGRDHPGRLWSLWDIMNEFKLHRFTTLIIGLEQFAANLERIAKDGGAGTHDPALYEQSRALLGGALDFAGECNFVDCINTIAMSEAHLSLDMPNADVSTLAADIRVARDALTTVAWNRTFLIVATGRASYVDNRELFGPDVYKEFPAARFDIREAGNCFAADCNTAAVFHAMRAAEHGLKWLAKNLRVKLTANKKPTPITEATWNTIITGTQNALKAFRLKRASEKRRAQLEQYARAADHCDYMREIWRNAVSHAHKSYDALEAESAINRVRDFMQLLTRMR